MTTQTEPHITEQIVAKQGELLTLDLEISSLERRLTIPYPTAMRELEDHKRKELRLLKQDRDALSAELAQLCTEYDDKYPFGE